jgi:hypothetical protein
MMAAVNDSSIKIFEGSSGQYEIHAEAWAKILLLAETWGWKPMNLRMSYLASGQDVSETDAHNLAAAGQRILDAALVNPSLVYPVNVDMGKLYEVVEFCKAGSFRICQ